MPIHFLFREGPSAHEVVLVYLEEVGVGPIPDDVEVLIVELSIFVAAAFRLSRASGEQRGGAILDVRAGCEPLFERLRAKAYLSHPAVLGLDVNALEIDRSCAVHLGVNGGQLDVIDHRHHHREG